MIVEINSYLYIFFTDFFIMFYLGFYIGPTEKDINVRKALAWRALHSLKSVWKSSMNNDLKRRLFSYMAVRHGHCKQRSKLA
jgi:hypothetical protein